MNKRIFLISAAVVVLLCSCHSSKVRITGRFVGTAARTVYLEQITPLAQKIVDSVMLDCDGNYRLDVKNVARTPSLYNLIYNNETIPLLIAGGDRLVVGSVGSVVRNYTVEGSEESELLCDFYKSYVAGAQGLDAIAAAYGNQTLSDGERRRLAQDYTAEYYRIRRDQLRFIIEYKEHLAAVYALYQRLPGEANLFNGDSDVVYYRTVAEAIEKRYPESSYLTSLHTDIARMDARLTLSAQLTEMGYPDLDLPDMYGKAHRLSSLAGKVVLLDFWSAAAGNSNAMNAELRKFYPEYAGSDVGFEVYQVSLDTSKPVWINAVQEQQLPWISVCDLLGGNSTAAGLYNIQKLPTNFLIDKTGTIVARDIYGRELKRKLDELTR